MGEENLIPQNKRTKEEQRKIATMGGKASGEARRKKKEMKKQIELLLSLPFPDLQDRNGKKLKNIFQQLGIDEDNIDNQMAMIISMWQRALKGDVNAFNTLRDTVGEKPSEKINLNDNTKTSSILESINRQLENKNAE